MADRDSRHQQSIREYYSPSASRRSSTSDVFSDIHALNPVDDPSHPPAPGGDDTLVRGLREPSPSRRSRSLQPSVHSRWSSLRRSGGSAYAMKRGSIASRLDGHAPTSTYQSGNSSDHEAGACSSVPRRMSSNATSIYMPRTQSPYHGAAGPSHPYAMYNQDIGVSRTPSNATSSTTRTPLRPYVGPSRPTHPYGTYSQNIVSEDGSSPAGRNSPAVPLGFNGGDQRYRRRLGPEGEDADDFIGPDGHTEQLPAYTRYPNDLPPKSIPIQPAGDTHSPHDPFADSQATLNGSPIEESDPTINLPNHEASPHNLPSSDISRSADEGGHYKEAVLTKGKKRICKVVPLWLLMVVISILLAIVVGCIVGVVIRNHHSANYRSQPAPTSEPISSPHAG